MIDISAIWDSFCSSIENYIIFPLMNITIVDILDILLLAILFYLVYSFIKERHTGKLALGVGAFIIVYLVSDWFGMHAINSIMRNLYTVGIIGLCVIFQPELRVALEQVGSTYMKVGKFAKHHQQSRERVYEMVEEISAAAFELSAKGEGALIVIERNNNVRNQMTEGVKLDAFVTRQLLCNIFVNKSPLHDGAVIIRNLRVSEASSKSKNISDNSDMLSGLGTRHRAAVRITEVSDAVVVIVSEESGIISIANNKLLKRHYNEVGKNGRHKSNDLRDDLFKLITGTSIDDMIPACADNGDILSDEELRDFETDSKSGGELE